MLLSGLILLPGSGFISNALKEIKTGQLFQNIELSRPVESSGIEPKSGNLHVY